MRHQSVKHLARLLLEPCDPAKGQTPSATVTADYRALTRGERGHVDLLVTRTRRIVGLRSHRRLPCFMRPFIALRWGCFNAFGAEFAPLAWLTRAFIRDVPTSHRQEINEADASIPPESPTPGLTAPIAPST
ncbi:hypothetical protein [Salinicola acroporae]|uniref:Uncharacterized protein n=1 Tax=Salinicola acroporae TaxID=1541440 RepID=A0ABT6I3Y0_9GAMM|nr:hypothetical protein [Salinicola acroporae]MDH4572232.1 hypothetical protein [Salinicola acroporae]